jgi:hypothetical protein
MCPKVHFGYRRQRQLASKEDFDTVEFTPPAAHEQALDVIKRNDAMAQIAPD